MVWIYLIVQAVGLGIIAWTFKVKDKDEYAITFEIGGLLSLCWVVAAAPLPLKALTAFLMVRFRSRINHTFGGGQAAILSFVRTGLQALSNLGFTGFNTGFRLKPESVTRFLNQNVFRWRQVHRTENASYPNLSIIDVEAIEAPRWF